MSIQPRLGLALLASFFVSSGEGNVPWGTPGPIGSTTPSTGVFTQVFGVQSSGNGTKNGVFNINGTSKAMSIVADSVDSSANSNIAITRYSSTATRDPDIYFFRAHGSQASPSAPATNDIIGALRFDGYDGTNWQNGGLFDCLVDNTISAGILPTRCLIATTNTSGVQTIALTIDSAQKATFAGAATITGLTTLTGGVLAGASSGTCNLNGGAGGATCSVTGVPTSCKPVGGYATAPNVTAALWCAISGTTVTCTDTALETATVNVHCQ